MFKIDLNCDLGEGAKHDADIIPLITSANIACGFHAGDLHTMADSVLLCKNSKASLGAHPGYADRENFGRTAIETKSGEVYDLMLYQLGALSALACARGLKLSHVKPHGALYNAAAKNRELAIEVVEAIKDFDSNLILLALSGSEMINEAKSRGLKYASEVFADRAYEADGSLRKRSLPGSMIEDENEAMERVIKMITDGKVKAYTGEQIEIEAHSVCVHGDGAKALDFVKRLNEAFVKSGIEKAPLSEVIK